MRYPNDKSKIIIPRLLLRERVPPLARPTITLEPQQMHWQILGPNGKVLREAEQPCHNIVLNNAKELVATLGLFEQSDWAVVGTGSTAPDPSQTGLVNELARTNAGVSGMPDTVTEVSTGVWEVTRYRQFTAAQVGGQNLTEWGWSGSGSVGNNLMSRELFRDGGNNPITLTLDSDQQLRLIYKVRVVVGPTTPQNASINITGIGIRTGRLTLYKVLQGAYSYNANPVAGLSRMCRASPNNPTVVYTVNRLNLDYNQSDAPFDWGAFAFPAGYQNYVANSKERKMNNFVRSTSEVVATIVGIGVSEQPSSVTGKRCRLYFEFDIGQEITKDNLHELTIEGFKVSWT